MSSLVMLAAPFANLNIFSNTAIAQEYDKYGDSSYSTYPTDDKKYECRTGPFEGFFVSSVEFCKHVKFNNDRKDHSRDNNQTGTQGPIGPEGPPGPAGAIGPSGITTLNNTNLYFVIGNVTIENVVRASSIAFCETGDVVFDGGFRLHIGGDDRNNVGGSPFFILYDRPLPPTGSTVDSGYKVEFFSASSSTGEYEAFAYCFDNPPLRP